MNVDGTKISMIRGDSEMIEVSCNERPFQKGDIITFTVRKMVLDKKEIEKVITEFTDEGGGIIEITPADTKDLTFGGYVYDIQLEDAWGAVTTIIKPSDFVIMPEVSYSD